MDPDASRSRRPNGLHLTYPDIAFAPFSLEPLLPLFSLGGWNARKGLLGHASKHLRALWSYGQHRLHEKATPAFIADVSHAADLVTMGQIDVGRILHQQHHGRGIRLVPGLVHVRLHQGRKGHKALVSLQVCM